MQVTLSVPELLNKALAAFKLETPELFGPGGFAQDFSSSTAVLGDRTTGRIAHLPVVGDYDENNGGWKAAAQDVETLMEDVPVTLNQLPCASVKIRLFDRMGSKVGLDDAAIANLGWSLGKNVVDRIISAARTNVSHSVTLQPNLVTLDTFDGALREQCTAQKMSGKTRWAFVNTAIASALNADDRVKSELFFGQKNGEEGYRVWRNLGGFQWVREYNDIQNAGMAGLMGDHRLACVSVRKIHTMTAATLKAMNIPEVMRFYPVQDEQSKLELTGVVWQEPGTGDTYLSVAMLLGVGVGNQGGPAGTVTDNAGCLILT